MQASQQQVVTASSAHHQLGKERGRQKGCQAHGSDGSAHRLCWLPGGKQSPFVVALLPLSLPRIKDSIQENMTPSC